MHMLPLDDCYVGKSECEKLTKGKPHGSNRNRFKGIQR